MPNADDWTCPRCGSDNLWVPTYCNHGHCADCFTACRKGHAECGWTGIEHESFFDERGRPPGRVHTREEHGMPEFKRAPRLRV